MVLTLEFIVVIFNNVSNTQELHNRISDWDSLSLLIGESCAVCLPLQGKD